jgi:signal peptidase I
MTKKSNQEDDFSVIRFILDVFVDVALVVVLVIVFRQFLFAPFQVSGPSMCDTFNMYGDECANGDGEYVITSRLGTWDVFGFSLGNIDRGDVVVFEAPYGSEGEYYIKRIIGIAGDSVRIEDGEVYLMKDGESEYVMLEEPYLNEDNLGATQTASDAVEVYEVPEGEYFLMGDNRIKSSDSRRCFHRAGCNDVRDNFLEHGFIQGEVKFVTYPFSHVRWISS